MNDDQRATIQSHLNQAAEIARKQALANESDREVSDAAYALVAIAGAFRQGRIKELLDARVAGDVAGSELVHRHKEGLGGRIGGET